MTLLLAHILLPNIRVTKVDSKVDTTEGASAQLPICRLPLRICILNQGSTEKKMG